MTLWPERTINVLQELQQLSNQIDAYWPNSDRCLFRGQASVHWTLQPSIARELCGSKLNWFQVCRLEREMANRFRHDAHRELSTAVLPRRDCLINWWPMMRHYGAPTRLLDWSLSPYVALYFAVEQRWDEDGALWWFRASTAEHLMSCTYGTAFNDHQKYLLDGEDDPFQIASPPNMLFVFEVKRAIERIGNQQGLFSVSLDPNSDHAKVLEDLTGYADGPHCEKLIIPKARKPDLLRELQLMNVTGKSMFPGLDGLGRTLTELTKLSIRFDGF